MSSSFSQIYFSYLFAAIKRAMRLYASVFASSKLPTNVLTLLFFLTTYQSSNILWWLQNYIKRFLFAVSTIRKHLVFYPQRNIILFVLQLRIVNFFLSEAILIQKLHMCFWLILFFILSFSQRVNLNLLFFYFFQFIMMKTHSA